ncbi:Fanconi anemia core complex-associated protein 20 isoform X1 [Pezoporus wallicus]|uniref:Fanconi anemia core complex-associated protein 20 isoform X1 n=1 Tax=Pezoporus wallicus TaxID=35540 RepID=UPI002550988F|nr:Fanconi anemia core complex-associated protein 20 isoform X1 [Pezoporus wallicus]XP_061306420.1 Fanconi anemia core complex-associated protein 20 isoform X1 [Pezoporus flaviventris]
MGFVTERHQSRFPTRRLAGSAQVSRVLWKDQAKHVVGEDTEAISKPDASLKSCKLTWHGSSVHHLALPQCSAKALSYQEHCRGTAQNSMENGKENHGKELQLQTHQGDVSFGEARCSPAEENLPLASLPQTKSCKEETENQGEGAPTLDSCPMCLICFSGISGLCCYSHSGTCSARTQMPLAEQLWSSF